MAIDIAPKLPSASWTVELPDEAATARLDGSWRPR